MLKKMSNVFQNTYRRIKSPWSMSHERACKPTSAVRDTGPLPALSSYRSYRCFSDKPLLEALNSSLEKPVFTLCGFLGFPNTLADGNYLNYPCTQITLPSDSHTQEQRMRFKSRFSRPIVCSQLKTPSDGKNSSSAAVINHCPLNTTVCQMFLIVGCDKSDFHPMIFLRFKLCWNFIKKKKVMEVFYKKKKSIKEGCLITTHKNSCFPVFSDRKHVFLAL